MRENEPVVYAFECCCSAVTAIRVHCYDVLETIRCPVCGAVLECTAVGPAKRRDGGGALQWLRAFFGVEPKR